MLSEDQKRERDRYESFSSKRLESIESGEGWKHGATAIRESIRAPYLWLHREIETAVTKESRVLDLCGGDGIHAMTGAIRGASVTVADISQASLQLAEQRAAALECHITTLAGDIHDLEFGVDGQFDLITMVGSLSYCHHDEIFQKLHLWVKKGGVIVIVDSLNHNPIYRLNRKRASKRGERSQFTIDQMPTRQTLLLLEKEFSGSTLELHYFGILAFLEPVLGRFLSQRQIAGFLFLTDTLLRPLLKWWAFKIGVKIFHIR